MAKSLDPQRADINAKSGHFKAYGADGTVLWEKPDFTVGVDMIPGGLSEAMKAMQITNLKGEVIGIWDPWHMFGERSTVV